MGNATVIGHTTYDATKVAQVTLLDMQANADPISVLTVGSTGGGRVLQTGATRMISIADTAGVRTIVVAAGTFWYFRITWTCYS